MYSKFIFKFQVLSSIYHQYYFLFTLLHFYLWKFFLWPFKWNIWAVNSPSIVFRSRWHLSCQLLKKSHNIIIVSHDSILIHVQCSFILYLFFYFSHLKTIGLNCLLMMSIFFEYVFFRLNVYFATFFVLFMFFFLNGNASFVFKDYIYKEYIFQINSLFS